MRKLSSVQLSVIGSVAYLAGLFLYIILTVNPVLYFHHVQPPFLLSCDFLSRYFNYPGGPAELIAHFLMQSFINPFSGTFVLFGVALTILFLTNSLLNSVYCCKLNRLWSLIPVTLSVVLTNNYNLPYSVIISVVVVLLLMLFLAKTGKKPLTFFICYMAGVLITYLCCGSGYLLLFTAGSIFLVKPFRLLDRMLVISFIMVVSLVIPSMAYHFIFAIPEGSKYFYFFAPKLYFMAYNPSAIFYLFLSTIPVLLMITTILSKYQRTKLVMKLNMLPLNIRLAFSFAVIGIVAYLSHAATYMYDAKKIVESDYYCYTHNATKTAKAATGLQEYSFTANLNYNLVFSKAENLNENFFGFLQLSGTESLLPDNEFLAERAFIAADFYYHLGYISEARHWAYEALVFYPYSQRALQLLVKIHLVTREYKAAERHLKTLGKGIFNSRFIHEFQPFVDDTSLTNTNKEIVEKRSFIPAERELSPFIEQRLIELLQANGNNKSAFEFLLIYYLLDAQFDNFIALYPDANKFYNRPVPLYEEALLMYGEKTGEKIQSKFSISDATLARYKEFNHTFQQYKGDKRLARNMLYRNFGGSYFFYIHFIYPRIVKPEIITDEDALPQI